MKAKNPKSKLTISSVPFNNSGFSLIEVIVSIALMGTLLALSLVSYSAHVRQMHLSQNRIKAVKALDALMVKWIQSGQQLPLNQSGDCEGEGKGKYLWATSLREIPLNFERDYKIFRLDIYNQAAPSSSLTYVEFPIHDIEEP